MARYKWKRQSSKRRPPVNGNKVIKHVRTMSSKKSLSYSDLVQMGRVKGS